jgi:hypothetical protein
MNPINKLINFILGDLLGANKPPQPFNSAKPVQANEPSKADYVFSASPRPTSTPLPTVAPTSTPTPTPVPQRQQPQSNYAVYQPGEPYYMDFSGYNGSSSQPIPQPPKNIAELLFKMLPNEATPAATIAFSENLKYDPSGVNPHNNDKSIDYGLFQNNSKTINEMLNTKRFGGQLRSAGINKPADVLNNVPGSIEAYRLTKDYEKEAGAAPYSWWYGWQNRGFNPMPEQSLETLGNKKYQSGNPAYFKLQEYLSR